MKTTNYLVFNEDDDDICGLLEWDGPGMIFFREDGAVGVHLVEGQVYEIGISRCSSRDIKEAANADGVRIHIWYFDSPKVYSRMRRGKDGDCYR